MFVGEVFREDPICFATRKSSGNDLRGASRNRFLIINLFVGPRDPGNTGQTTPVNIDHLSAPASLAVFADCAQINDFQAPASPDHPMLEEFYFFETTYATIHFRHGRRAETVYVDGHSASERPEAGSEDVRLPGQLLGRLARKVVVPE